jgi:hypothetical protein
VVTKSARATEEPLQKRHADKPVFDFSNTGGRGAISTAAAQQSGWMAFEKRKGSVRRVVELAELLRLPADTTTVRTLR